MKCKIYVSDEGYGHLVRQRAIFEELLAIEKGLTATVQTAQYVDAAKRIFQNAEFIRKFNNISWPRKSNGSPDLKQIKRQYGDYIKRSDDFISNEEELSSYDFVVSDFVYEAFPVARANRIPSFGVAHFTWDWFFSKMYPTPVSMKLLKRLVQHAKQADVIYFPPFTPEEILVEYDEVAVKSPLIIHKRPENMDFVRKEEFTIILMDSGANVLSSHIEQAVKQLVEMDHIHFLIAEKYGIRGPNITTVPATDFFSDYMPFVDLVITRGGFNTISECIAYRTPILLLGEPMNPEIERNLLYVKQEQLGSFISLDKFVNNLQDSLYGFIEHEYQYIKRRMDEHEFATNGAEVIARDILERVSGC